jgi:hypothetical protein
MVGQQICMKLQLKWVVNQKHLVTKDGNQNMDDHVSGRYHGIVNYVKLI